MASRRSVVSNSSAMVARKSASYKRHVSFVHNRKRAASIGRPRLRSQEHHTAPFTLQERYVRDKAQAEAHSQTQEASGSPSIALRDTPQPDELPVVRSRKSPIKGTEDLDARKTRIASHYWKDDARKVSTEMEKMCDEAFNHSPLTSSVPTPMTQVTGIRDSQQTYGSSATSFSVHEDPVPMPIARHSKAREINVHNYQQRPLPKPPSPERMPMSSEHLGSYTQRELAKTRDLLKKRAAESDMSPGYLDEVIAHLDRLMQPSAIRLNEEERRAVSTPDPYPGIPRKDTFDQIMEKGNIGFRSVSEPPKKYKAENREATIRLVDGSQGFLEPISPVKPLTIRKKSGSSTPSAGSPRHTPIQPIFQTAEPRPYYQQGEERRSAGLALLGDASLEAIEEDEDKENFDPADRTREEYLGKPKKRNWFRRHQPVQRSHDTDIAPPPPVKDQWPLTEPQNVAQQAQKRTSGAPSEESQISESKKGSGKGRFFRIFTGKRDSKDSQKSAAGDYDLDDGESVVTEDSTIQYNPKQAYMSGALQNTSHGSVLKRRNKGKHNSTDSQLMPPPPVPRVIVPQHQNWLARFLRIKPAVSVLCFQVSKVRARKEVAGVFREWRKYGMRDIVVDKAAGRVWAKVDVKNCMHKSLISLISSFLPPVL